MSGGVSANPAHVLLGTHQQLRKPPHGPPRWSLTPYHPAPTILYWNSVCLAFSRSSGAACRSMPRRYAASARPKAPRSSRQVAWAMWKSACPCPMSFCARKEKTSSGSARQSALYCFWWGRNGRVSCRMQKQQCYRVGSSAQSCHGRQRNGMGPVILFRNKRASPSTHTLRRHSHAGHHMPPHV